MKTYIFSGVCCGGFYYGGFYSVSVIYGNDDVFLLYLLVYQYYMYVS